MTVIFKFTDRDRGCVWLDENDPRMGEYAPRQGSSFWAVEKSSENLSKLLGEASSDNFDGKKPIELAGQISLALEAIMKEHFRCGSEGCEIEVTNHFANALGLADLKMAVMDWIG